MDKGRGLVWKGREVLGQRSTGTGGGSSGIRVGIMGLGSTLGHRRVILGQRREALGYVRVISLQEREKQRREINENNEAGKTETVSEEKDWVKRERKEH